MTQGRCSGSAEQRQMTQFGERGEGRVTLNLKHDPKVRRGTATCAETCENDNLKE